MTDSERSLKFLPFTFAVSMVMLVFEVGMLMFVHPTLSRWLMLAGAIMNFTILALLRDARSRRG